MDPYEYLTVFVSVILGLAVVHLLSGVALILDTRVRERVDWIHGVWTANVFITTLLVWWFNFGLAAVTEWTLPHFLNLVAYSVVLYLMAGLLYPVRGDEIIDFRAHFEANRPRSPAPSSSPSEPAIGSTTPRLPSRGSPCACSGAPVA